MQANSNKPGPEMASLHHSDPDAAASQLHEDDIAQRAGYISRATTSSASNAVRTPPTAQEKVRPKASRKPRRNPSPGPSTVPVKRGGSGSPGRPNKRKVKQTEKARALGSGRRSVLNSFQPVSNTYKRLLTKALTSQHCCAVPRKTGLLRNLCLLKASQPPLPTDYYSLYPYSPSLTSARSLSRW